MDLMHVSAGYAWDGGRHTGLVMERYFEKGWGRWEGEGALVLGGQGGGRVHFLGGIGLWISTDGWGKGGLWCRWYFEREGEPPAGFWFWRYW